MNTVTQISIWILTLVPALTMTGLGLYYLWKWEKIKHFLHLKGSAVNQLSDKQRYIAGLADCFALPLQVGLFAICGLFGGQNAWTDPWAWISAVPVGFIVCGYFIVTYASRRYEKTITSKMMETPDRS